MIKIASYTEDRNLIMAVLHECNMAWVVNEKRKCTLAYQFESGKHYYFIMLAPVSGPYPRPMKLKRFPKDTFTRDEVLLHVAEITSEVSKRLGEPDIAIGEMPDASAN